MKKMYRTLAVSALLGGLALTTYAQEFKAGFVNTDRIFREASSAKAAQSKLEQEFSKRERELIAASNQLKSASEAFERDAPTMSESQRLAKQRALVEQDRDFQRKSREFQEDLSVRKNWLACLSRPTGWCSKLLKRKSTTSSCRKLST